MTEICNQDLFDIKETIATTLFERKTYPWELLDEIHDYILALGNGLPNDRYIKQENDIWIAKSATVAKTACLSGPLIVDEYAEIRHCAFIRGNVIVGKNVVVGNSTELKNVILFNGVQVPHYNYIGDSILGFKSHMGAGAVTSNLKSDKSLIVVKQGDKFYHTGRKKMGAILGDFVEVGCNSVLNPGTIVGKESNIYPTSNVRGVIPAHHIYKDKDQIIPKVK